jgi:hypothetical protein
MPANLLLFCILLPVYLAYLVLAALLMRRRPTSPRSTDRDGLAIGAFLGAVTLFVVAMVRIPAPLHPSLGLVTGVAFAVLALIPLAFVYRSGRTRVAAPV